MGVGMNAGGAGAGGGGGVELFPMESLLALEEHSLNMALFRALGLVLAVKEAMWEELLGRVARGDRQLVRYGWGKNDYSEGASRVLFDGLVEQYRKDVRARVALWHSMVLSGWAYPRQDPLTKAELMEEERLRQDILEARRNAKEEDLEGASRFIRLMVGVKMPDAGSMT
ncbi:predicted protein [Postia placenta Mad-698-R]|uniref:Uncharacterized protein n=2 Tax=Rhodonia placenta TaxID=104341 RepID=A0A1X6NF74_9APHY|nr:hypothetical protein POSPLADRAFT_1127874 [Postia placenta MAD-698-R-SB12]EED77760.1 predicted protein [Postia placenta Mad-698-R]KAF9819875.1 hypothetical protein IEO21_01736 [Postia placenta]OSX67291.1 hypothetical protein POSPLADRAFT_1127874 [Postia placenta MAD-698-R-SB12]